MCAWAATLLIAVIHFPACHLHHADHIPPDEGVLIEEVPIELAEPPRLAKPIPHPAPEVILRFKQGCGGDDSDWQLSSRDATDNFTLIPFGALEISLKTEQEEENEEREEREETEEKDYDFVELIFDGKPLLPKKHVRKGQTLSLPCPRPGRHSIQARFLKENIWSRLSPVLRFEMQLPQRPVILAVSNVNGAPIALERNARPSITTGRMRIRLADVHLRDRIVAYLDGKPVTAEMDDDSCCRTIPLRGWITPGVHTLTVRAVGCPEDCGITSELSNQVTFHYYEEDIYLLRPGQGCCDRQQREACQPRSNSESAAAIEQKQAQEGVQEPTGAGMNGLPTEWEIEGEFEPFDLEGAPAVDAQESEQGCLSCDSPGATFEEDHPGSGPRGVEPIPLTPPIPSEPRIEAEPIPTPAEDSTGPNLRPASLEAQWDIVPDQAPTLDEIEGHKPLDPFRSSLVPRSLASLLMAAITADAQNASAPVGQPVPAASAAVHATAHTVDMGAASGGAVGVDAGAAPPPAPTDDACQRPATQPPLPYYVGFHCPIDNDAVAVLDAVKHASQIAMKAAQRTAKLAAEVDRLAAEAEAAANAAARQAWEVAATISTAETAERQTKTALQRTEAWPDAESVTPLAVESTAGSAVLHADNDATIAKLMANSARQHAELVRSERDIAEHAATEVRFYAVEALYHAAAARQTALQIEARATAAAGAREAAVGTFTNARLQAKNADLTGEADALLLNGWLTARTDAESHAREAAKQRTAAEQEKANVVYHVRMAKKAAGKATDVKLHRDEAHKAAGRANFRVDRAEAHAEQTNKSLAALRAQAQATWRLAVLASRRRDIQAEIESGLDALDNRHTDAEVARERNRAAMARLRSQRQAAISSAGVETAETNARTNIRSAEARSRILLADQVTAPSSPFYFASTAHFPIRHFGMRGEVIDREGLVIYEDMKLSFEPSGRYRVHFRYTKPDIPVSVRLQFLIQPNLNAPWYTITLAPIELPHRRPPNRRRDDAQGAACGADTEDYHCKNPQNCCAEPSECICSGRNEILRRCYAEIGENARIRRQGTARFGFGVKVPTEIDRAEQLRYVFDDPDSIAESIMTAGVKRGCPAADN